jgi:transcription elongation factor GreA
VTDKAEHLTHEHKATLEAELAELEGPKRAEMVEAIKTARGFGDLSENFEYHAAKNEQGLLERRITILRARLDSAVIVEAGGSDVVEVGCRVVVRDATQATMTLEVSNLGGEGTVSPESPLGAALMGRRTGETFEVQAPKGVWTATIVEIL